MATAEKNLTKKIQLICGERGWQCHDVNVGGGRLAHGGYFKSGLPPGFPDLLILTNDGRVLFIEAKVGSNKPSDKQNIYIKLLRRNNFFADVVWSVEDFNKLINDNFSKYSYKIPKKYYAK